MTAPPRLLVTCGLPGAGKTTLARRLAASRPAVRLTKDDWMFDLGSDPWDDDLRPRVEARLVGLALELLRLERSVVVDFGSWARAERDELREAARAAGAGVELHVCGAPLDEGWRRVQARNAVPPWDACPITREHLEAWAAAFQAPDAAELALFDPPPEPG